jgi:hypothetical protein
MPVGVKPRAAIHNDRTPSFSYPTGPYQAANAIRVVPEESVNTMGPCGPWALPVVPSHGPKRDRFAYGPSREVDVA